MAKIPIIREVAAQANDLQTQVDTKLSGLGTPVVKDSVSNITTNFTLSSIATSEGFYLFRVRAEVNSSTTCRFEGRINGSTVLEQMLTGHSNAQWASGLGQGMTIPVKQGDLVEVVRTGVVGSMQVDAVLEFIPLVTT